MSIKIQGIQNSSQLDPGSVLKSAHDDKAQALRTYNALTDVPPAYTKVDLVYNSSGSCTEAKFYEGTEFNTTRILCTDASNLNSKYFVIYSADDKGKYVVWYNIDNAGVAPVIPNALIVSIDLTSSDSAAIVALATKLTLARYSDFLVSSTANQVTVTNTVRGYSSPVFNLTGFTITVVTEGITKLIKHLQIPFANNIRYIFNEIERKFEVFELVEPVSQRGDSFRPPVDADSFTVLRPNTIKEIYQYRRGGISGEIIYTITITYTDATKDFIASLVAV